MEAEIYQRAQEIQDVNCRLLAANEALQQEIIARQEAEEARRRTYTELAQLV
jgi:C4-dicarboxylate-specific signal transduction histidine kinase